MNDFDSLFNEFFRENPQHIVGLSQTAIEAATGSAVKGSFMDTDTVREFLTWVVRSHPLNQPRAERVWLMWNKRMPGEFPLPFPWSSDGAA